MASVVIGRSLGTITTARLKGNCGDLSLPGFDRATIDSYTTYWRKQETYGYRDHQQMLKDTAQASMCANEAELIALINAAPAQTARIPIVVVARPYEGHPTAAVVGRTVSGRVFKARILTIEAGIDLAIRLVKGQTLNDLEAMGMLQQIIKAGVRNLLPDWMMAIIDLPALLVGFPLVSADPVEREVLYRFALRKAELER